MPANHPPSRLSTDVATQLRVMVHTGEILPGNRFPAQRELAELLSVSRATLREALELLQAEGYVDVRRGPHGGTFVTNLQEPALAWLHRMRQNSSTINEMFDFRVGVEMAAAHFAAMRRTPQDLDAMEKAILSIRSPASRGEFRAYDSTFHEAVAAAAKSPRLMQSIRQLRGEIFTPIDLLGIPTSPQNDAERHDGILSAIRESDSTLAAARMNAHVEHTREYLLRILANAHTHSNRA